MTTFEISIHALREEGDAPSGRNTPDTPNFYPRPPRGGRLEGAVHGIKTKDFYPRPPRGGRRVSGLVGASPTYFYPRPPRGGRQLARRLQGVQQGFLSTPSARRATGDVDRVEATIDISIHALREEGDDLPCSRYLEIQDFYPRPPRGGRLEGAVHGIKTKDFYPRPPRGGRRVSGLVGASPTYFYPRPPRGGRQLARRLQGVQQGFLSTPSARRATGDVDRVEATIDISIHALREEGDDLPCSRYLEIQDFYPRPPRGGRLCNNVQCFNRFQFLSTPSARRATRPRFLIITTHRYFYPRPPRGGRPTTLPSLSGSCNFYPRPPRGGRPGCQLDLFCGVRFLSTPSARRATRAAIVAYIGDNISIHALREEGD